MHIDNIVRLMNELVDHYEIHPSNYLPESGENTGGARRDRLRRKKNDGICQSIVLRSVPVMNNPRNKKSKKKITTSVD